jgi:hypothetical protein
MFPSERRISARRRSSYQEQSTVDTANMEDVEESDDDLFMIDKYARELGKYKLNVLL